MSGLTAFLLVLPGTALDGLWRLNTRAHHQLAEAGLWAVLLMVSVCVACATAAIGLWRLRRWGYWTAVVILSLNMTGDSLNAILGHDWRTLIGLPIAIAMLAYLVTSRRVFLA